MSFRITNFFISSSAQNPAGLQELGSTTLGSAANTISVSGLPAREYLKIVVHIPDKAASDEIALRFNSDSTAAHYGWTVVDDAGNRVVDNSDTEIHLMDAANAGGHQTTIEVFNTTDWKRTISMTNYAGIIGASEPQWAQGGGLWNQSDVVDEVTIFTISGNNMNAGTKVTVFGAVS